jgi:hypothetical protein
MFNLTTDERGTDEQGNRHIFGKKVGLIWRMLDCQHKKSSRSLAGKNKLQKLSEMRSQRFV